MRARPLKQSDLTRLLELVNGHLAALVPGWALTEAFLAEHLERDLTEPLTDPWVRERATLCAVEGERVLAAAHLLRYGDGPGVSDSYRGTGEIDWFVALPGRDDAATETLSVVRALMGEWAVRKEHGWPHGLPIVPMYGVPDCWPHVADPLSAAGYGPPANHHREALYGGWLRDGPEPEDPPLNGLALRRSVGRFGATRFSAILEDEPVGFCEIRPDLTRGGALPSMRGWAELAELRVEEGRRDAGIGGWLVRHAVGWLRLAGCDRVVLNVAAPDEAAGAGRFYRRFGWDVLAREVDPRARPDRRRSRA